MRRTKIAVFGSTGSVGKSALAVIEHLSDRFQLAAIAAHQSVSEICFQAERYQPGFVLLSDVQAAERVKSRLGRRFRVLGGMRALEQFAGSDEIDTLVMAMSGTGGLGAVLAALRQGKKVALASKELLVVYGEPLMRFSRRYHGTVLPVDSELAGIHQCLEGRDVSEVRRVILTASGGPFRRTGPPADARVRQVLRHPVWKMGKKITVDSATLMNKGLEVIETVRLFGFSPDQVTAVIHPESVVHALVEFRDGSFLAQLSVPDMRLPIQYCLTWPERQNSLVQFLDIEQGMKLHFLPVDQARFPCVQLAYRALAAGSSGTCALNAANDVAVEAFLQGQIAFGEIPGIIRKTLAQFTGEKKRKRFSISLLQQLERRAGEFARKLIGIN
ncbi:MAG: 1-deoxy-D-xylulose-5-phosphate reductoisomerase [candidate division WOR-3 bacterium]